MKSAAFSSFQSAAAPEARVGGERDDPPPVPPAVASGKPDPVPGPPLFPVGYRVSVGYMGLARAGEPACRRNGEPCELNNGRVVALRLVADFRERDCPRCGGSGVETVGLSCVGPDLTKPCPECLGTCTEWVQEYPKGWEYGVWIGDREHGWYTEAELLEKGYAPPAAAWPPPPMWPPFPGPAFPPVSPPPAEPRTVFVILDPVTGRYWTGHGWGTEPGTFVRYLSAKSAEDTRALLERNTPRKNLHVVECAEAADPNAPAVCDVCQQVVPQLAGYPRRDPATTAVVCQSCGKTLGERARAAAEWAEVVPLSPAELGRLDKLKGSDDPPHELGGEAG